MNYRETYVCMCDGGEIEYGFTYKVAPGVDDSLYDEPIGRSRDVQVVNEWLSSNTL